MISSINLSFDTHYLSERGIIHLFIVMPSEVYNIAIYMWSSIQDE